MAQYVKNADLRNEIIKCKELDELTPVALNMLMLMARKFSENFTYLVEGDKEDCISFAVMDCFQYWRGYDPNRSSNAFAYYTQIIKNGFAKGWRRLYGHMPKSKRISISGNNIYSI